MREDRTRRPTSVFGSGDEPDPRFSFANERTYLAWIRTALAFLGAAVALDVLKLSVPHWLSITAAVAMAGLSAFASIAAWTHWAASEHALRHSEPLPGPRLSLVTVGLAMVAVAIVVGIVWP
ncbi:hypothetical protein ASE12_14340 [Aeromicrobium sp. Root236]|uniref:YidH family protein n=1 Tax=Aeromicrobium sp. Root236 TaxID=1736498 RepID=UPI0006F7C12E|nr:DUF202 domain-containing protein [Aeromicrobium sp. Root236]KRC65832.1 hypothetical protein ASE12_14340 [Aeromicrobium sp. Root236]